MMTDLTHQDFESLFKGHQKHPNASFTVHWFMLYKKYVQSLRRSRLELHQERFLEVMGFDLADPIMNPEGKEWTTSKQIELTKKERAQWSSGQILALENMRDTIEFDRMMRGVSLRGAGQGSYFLYAADEDEGRSVFVLVDQAQAEEYATSYWHTHPRSAVVDDQEKRVVVVISSEDRWGVQGIHDALAALVRDKNSPEFGYVCHIIVLFPRTYDGHSFTLVQDDSIVQVSAVIIGAGERKNKQVNSKRSFLRGDGKPKRFKNVLGLLPESIAQQEQERYDAHNKRKKLMKIAGGKNPAKNEPPIL